MKKLFLLIVLFVFVSGYTLFAQTKVITGTVTSSVQGEGAIPGVTIQVKGTTVGSITDLNGKYSLTAPQNATTLIFSYIGMKKQEVQIGNRSVIDCILESEVTGLDEVVVTALGITRQKKALGYAVQDVQGAELAKAGNSSVLSSLSGRFSGIQVTSASGQMGGGSRILVRGAGSLTQNNQPLYVVDGIPLDNSDYSYGATGSGGYDYGNTATDLNSDDIESITVLKGAGATALYGSRAANGVILVTTKKAKLQAQQTLGVSVNSNVTFENASIFPKLQKLYGAGVTYSDADGGDHGFLTADINQTNYRVVEYATDESWGPKYDPNINVLQWNAFDKWDTEHYLKATPWTYPKNDYTHFFKTGVGYQNNIQINGGDEKNAFRLSYTNYNQTGIYTNSKLDRNTVSISGTTKPNKTLDAFINVNYLVNKAIGRPETGYGDNNPVQKMWQWSHTSDDYKDLEAYKNPDGSQRSWNRISWEDPGPNYTDNPYWSRYMNYENDRRDRVYGNAGFNLNLLSWMKFTGRFGVDYYDSRMETRTAIGSQAQSYYDNDQRQNMERNIEGFLTIDKRLANSNIGVNAIFGANRMDRLNWRTGAYTDGGLVVPEMYVLTNSKNAAIVWDNKSSKRINSVYGNVTLDYKRTVYLDITARNDWSSTLPAKNRSYFYPSVNLSFLASELTPLKNLSWLSLAKLRLGIAQVGNDTDPYSFMNYYTINTPFGSNPRLQLPTNMANLDLKPEKTRSWEVGTEFAFFKNRLGFELTYYQKHTFDQIIPIQVSATTGYSAFYTNSGQMTNTGVEFNLRAVPVKIGDFQWDVSLNMGTLSNKVNEVSKEFGLTYLSLGNAPFKVQIGAFEGQTYPVIYGTDYVRDNNGNKIVDPSTGLYDYTPVKPIGNVTPTFTAGLTNSFTYKGFDVSVLIDMQRGGHIYYLSNAWGMYSGLLEETAKTNENGKNIREPVADGGGLIVDGVYGNYDATAGYVLKDADGNAVTSPVKNTTRVEASDWATWYYDGPDAQSVFKTDFFKLREVHLGYTLPAKFTGPIKGVRVSVYGRNLLTWGQENKNFDPEYLQMAGSNAQGSEGGYLPSTRTLGFGLNFNF